MKTHHSSPLLLLLAYLIHLFYLLDMDMKVQMVHHLKRDTDILTGSDYSQYLENLLPSLLSLLESTPVCFKSDEREQVTLFPTSSPSYFLSYLFPNSAAFSSFFH